jgi:hypothetical protein
VAAHAYRGILTQYNLQQGCYVVNTPTSYISLTTSPLRQEILYHVRLTSTTLFKKVLSLGRPISLAIGNNVDDKASHVAFFFGSLGDIGCEAVNFSFLDYLFVSLYIPVLTS